MKLRGALWGLGFSMGLTVAFSLPSKSLRPIAFGLLFLGFGISAEIFDYLRDRARRERTRRLLDFRPADGIVEVRELLGVQSVPNCRNPEIGRFVSVDPDFKSPEGCGASVVSDPEGRWNPPLIGRVAVASLYLGAHGKRWTDEEIAESCRALLRAGRWVEEQAQSWNAPCNLELLGTYFEEEWGEEEPLAWEDQPNNPENSAIALDTDSEALRAVTLAARRLGFEDAKGLSRAVEARVFANHVVWLVHVRRGGTSHALPNDLTSFLGLAGISLAICHCRESLDAERLRGEARTDPVTVVHELLHLFGASDKYGRPLRKFTPSTVSHRDVMRLDETRLSRLRVDPATARELGWVGGPAPQRPKAGPGETRKARPSG